ncbi:LysM peptidoglycan-binding domain-containing protein [Paeniglutamicibacter sulfureus]|jgi:LysM repeat protein|uniref:LysM repeat protein n=1 Tax=Paeniglutamicibacter sulfureus TaxID=43666 RepID=A0ABU2BEI1_9MICC|nr:LysM peptidoglycan-binding domain-containing protein [Paeniglutamicibacter sulfureus]MDR7357003.1 LysM repeat protein [Paeniglutamicibacter sulfureus]
MSLAHNNRVRALGSAVATAAIPAVVLGSLAIPAQAAPLPTRDALQPKLATPAMVKAAEARISAHLVAAHVPGSVVPLAKKGGTATVKKNDTLSHIAARTGVSVSDLKKFNKLSSDLIKPGQVLRLSGGSSKASSPKASSNSNGSSAKAQTYKVAQGDVMGSIARKLGVSLSAVRTAAGNPANDTIYVNQTLRFGSTGSTGSAKAAPSANSGGSQGTYTVKSGDSPSMIAIRHNMSVSAFMKLNNLSNGDIIRPGDKLKISGSSSSASSSPSRTAAPSAPKSQSGGSSYKVVSGDTLGHIALKSGTPLNTILRLNPGLTYSTVLKIGRTLKVNSGGSAAPQSSGVNPTSSKPLVGNSFLGRTYKSDVVGSANDNKRELLSRNLPSPAAMQSMIASTARQMGVDPALAMAHAFQESGFNMNAVSPANAVGVMQVIPSAGEWAEGLVGRQLDLLNPQDNVTAGVAIIRSHQRNAPSMEMGIAYYYQGATGVKRNGMYADTKNYVASVMAHRNKFN